MSGQLPVPASSSVQVTGSPTAAVIQVPTDTDDVGYEPSGSNAVTATINLEAGESVGVQLPFGCRMGICQTCVVTLSGGHARDLRNGDERQPGDKVQTCISAAAGDCTLDI